MRKLFSLIMVLCLFCNQMSILHAQEIKTDDIPEGAYHAMDYEVSDSKRNDGYYRSRSTLPASYDARDYGYITSVKDQNPFGACWSFAVNASAETSAIKNKLVSKNYVDLSELQFAYYFYHRANDPLGNTKYDKNTATGERGDLGFLQNGGNNLLSSFALAQWMSPKDESDAPYVHVEDQAAVMDALKNSTIYQPEFAMKDAVFLPVDNTEAIKRALIKYGSISTAISTSGMTYYDQYFYNGDRQVDHSVTIVGYDDSISKDLFKTKPSSNGAWIIKNSWSEQANANGYFYLSYEQPLDSVVAFDYMAKNQHENNYFYDGSAGITAMVEDELTVANVFTAQKGTTNAPEYLEAVSIALASTDTDYSIDIYTDLKDASDPYSGIKAMSKPVTGYQQYEGIYTIELPEAIKVNKDSQFAIVVRAVNRYGGDVALFVASSDDYGWITSTESIQKNQSMQYDQHQWKDLYYDNVTVRTKAFTSCKALPSLHDDKASVTLQTTSYAYDGKTHQPEVIVSYDGKILSQGNDYSVTYDPSTVFGTVEVKITGMNAYAADSVIRSFEITKCDVHSLDIAEISDVMYNGLAHEPDVSIQNGTMTLTKGIDYDITYHSNVNPGIATVEIKGKGKYYTGTIEKTFTIVSAAIEDLDIGIIDDQVYSGKAITPDILIKDGQTVLKKGIDYTLTYQDNINVGTAKVTITGLRNYTGTGVTREFHINARDIQTLQIGSFTDSSYTGVPQTPDITIKHGTTILKNGSDYKITYQQNLNVGSVKVTITGLNNYTGSINSKSFHITPFDINKATLKDIADVVYTGKAQTPSIEIKQGSSMLKNGTDFKVTYQHNVNAGTAGITITGENNYTGTIQANFKILPCPLSDTMIGEFTNERYTGEAHTPDTLITHDTKVLKNGVDYQLTYQDNINAGEATVIITGTNNYTGDLRKHFVIAGMDINTLQIKEIADHTYTGSAQTPDITIKHGAYTLKNGTDYKLDYRDNVNVGTSEVIITGLHNYAGSECSKPFKINALTMSSITIEDIKDVTYTGKAFTPAVIAHKGTLNLKNGTDYTVTYHDNTNAGTANVTITGKNNFTGSIVKEFTILPCTIDTLTIGEIDDVIYSGKAQTPDILIKHGATILKNGVDYVMSYKDNVDIGTAKATITGIHNYTGTIATKQFHIAGTDIHTLDIGEFEDRIYTGYAQTPDITIKHNSYILKNGIDYKLSYSDNVEVGTVHVSITGMNHYAGTLTSKSFQIKPMNINQLTMEDIAEEVYTGNAHTPSIVLRHGTNILKAGIDYQVTYQDHINAGTANVSITGLHNYTGTISDKHFAIRPCDINTLTVGDFGDEVYTGNTHTPDLSIKQGSVILKNGIDYELSYHDNVEVGTATVIITGLHNYAGTISNKGFKITGKDIASLEIGEFADSTYTGKEITPDILIKDGSNILTNGIDYRLDYHNHINAGTASVTITGIHTYAGSIANKTFQIAPLDINTLTIEDLAECLYTGTAITPDVRLKHEADLLKNGIDYKLAYEHNIDVGTANVIITGMHNYTGTISSKTFQIQPKDLTQFTMEKLAEQPYTGEAITPAIIIKDGAKTLVDGTDYELTYQDNVSSGTATIIITGIHNYAGTSSSNHFKIVPCDLNTLSVDKLFDEIYTGQEHQPDVLIKHGSTILKNGTDYQVFYRNHVEVGTANVTIVGMNNYTGTITKEFTIKGIDIDTLDIDEFANSIYTGKEITPDILIKDGTKVLTNGIDYRLDYYDHVNAGTASVTITGIHNYAGTISTKHFEILPLDITTLRIEDFTDCIYTGEEIKPDVVIKHGTKTLRKDQDYKLVYMDNIKVGTANVTIMGLHNYAGTLSSKSFQIQPLAIDKVTIEDIKDEMYTGNEHMPSITIKHGSNTLVNGVDYTLTYYNHVNPGVASVVITGLSPYTGSVTKYFTIYRQNDEGDQKEPNKTKPSDQSQPVNKLVKKNEKLVTTGDRRDIASYWLLCILSLSMIGCHKARKKYKQSK